MNDWEAYSLKEEQTERIYCECCRSFTIHGSGHVLRSADWRGWYQLSFSEAWGSHPPVFTIYVGDWSEGAASTSRWAILVQWRTTGCGVLDWSPEDVAGITHFTPAGRDAVIGSDFEPELWRMVDAIIMKDSRLKELRA